MASETSVANKAAVLIGTRAGLLSLDDDRTVARVLKSVWVDERQAVLREGSWNFAMARFRLPALSAAPEFGFARAFQLPAACLRLIEVIDAQEGDWQMEGRTILSDLSAPLDIRAIIDVPELALWDAQAADALAARLALRCGDRIAGSAYDSNKGLAIYREALAKAKTTDALENPPIAQAESGWIEARWQGAWSGPARPGEGWR